MANLDFTLNGKPISVEVKPNEFLAEVLRYRLGMTGTKVGCNEAECGSLHCHRRWRIGQFVRLSCTQGSGSPHRNDRGLGQRPLASVARKLYQVWRGAMRVLHARLDHAVEVIAWIRSRVSRSPTKRSRSR